MISGPMRGLEDSHQHLPKYTPMGPSDLYSWEIPDCKNKVSVSPYRDAGVRVGGPVSE